MFELIATGTSLVANFLKLREERGEAINAEAFEDWLTNEAFPQLLKNSSQTLRSVISLKAAHHEQYSELLQHVLAIRRAVEGPTEASKWNALSEIDRGLLTYIYQQCRHDPLVHAEQDALRIALGADQASIERSAEYLFEQGWLSYHEHSDGSSISPQAAGVLLAWFMNEPQEYKESVRDLCQSLPVGNNAERLGSLAEASGTPIGLAYFLISDWATQGRLTFDDNTSPLEYCLIYHVRESFRRTMHSELRLEQS